MRLPADVPRWSVFSGDGNEPEGNVDAADHRARDSFRPAGELRAAVASSMIGGAVERRPRRGRQAQSSFLLSVIDPVRAKDVSLPTGTRAKLAYHSPAQAA